MSAAEKLVNPWDVPFQNILQYWDQIDRNGTYLPGIRALSLCDRFYLLVKVLKRHDLLHPWQYERCREVERAPDGYLDLWAREHGKSSIITIAGSIQEILKDPNLTVGIFSHTRPGAKKFMRAIKEAFEYNDVLRKAFPDVLWDKPQSEAPRWSEEGIVVKRTVNSKEATVEAWGLVDGQPTGSHFRLMVYDDVVTKESVSTPEQIIKTTEAWSLSDNLGSVGGRKWYIGTRYNFADTYDTILKRGAAIPRIYPATHDGTLAGKPVLFPQDEWDRRLRDQLESDLACQMMQNPLSGKQRMFNVSDLGIYECRPENLNVYILIDPARSKKKDSANTAMCVIGVDYAMNKYLLDGYNHKMDLQERWQGMRNLYVKWMQEPGVTGVHVGYEKFGAQSDLDYFKERMSSERLPMNIQELAWPSDGDGSKVDRVQRLVPDIKNHRFYLPYETNKDRLTAMQSKMLEQGYGYRIAQQIKRKDENGNLYDMSEQFKAQLGFFPFGGLKDLVDAASRIYDCDVSGPRQREYEALEPEF